MQRLREGKLHKPIYSDGDRPKRDLSVTVKMSKEDMELLNKAAHVLWPDAMMSHSSMVLSLAKLGARSALGS